MNVVRAKIEQRIKCVVPFCRHTRKADGAEEWVCADHWRLVPYWRRRVYYSARKRLWRAYDKSLPGKPVPPMAGHHFPEGWRHWPHDDDALEWIIARACFFRIWRRIRRHAIEAAAGIG